MLKVMRLVSKKSSRATLYSRSEPNNSLVFLIRFYVSKAYLIWICVARDVKAQSIQLSWLAKNKWPQILIFFSPWSLRLFWLKSWKIMKLKKWRGNLCTRCCDRVVKLQDARIASVPSYFFLPRTGRKFKKGTYVKGETRHWKYDLSEIPFKYLRLGWSVIKINTAVHIIFRNVLTCVTHCNGRYEIKEKEKTLSE